MPIATLAVSAFAAAGGAALCTRAVREHREAMRRREALLDDALALFADVRTASGPDHFPLLSGRLPGGARVEAEVFADTLVTRRLPQLWLKLTLRSASARDRPTIGAIARPTGAEYYSVAASLPDRFDPPFAADLPVVVRGRNAGPGDVDRAGPTLRRIFSDPAVKEAVIAPRAVRVIRQVAEGDRGAHMVFRQVRFAVSRVPPDLVLKAIADAEALDSALDEPGAALLWQAAS